MKMSLSPHKPTFFISTAFSLFLFSHGVSAFAASSSPEDFQTLLQMALKNSSDIKAAKAETKYQELNSTFISRTKNIPQVGLSAAYQRYYFDHYWTDSTGKLVVNDGQKPAYSLTVSYDLQKLFGPELTVAKRSVELSKIQERISERDVIKFVKQGYFSIVEIKSELTELKKLIDLFAKIDGVLKKQHRIGINNEVERRQFQVQRSILLTDFQSRSSDLDAAYTHISSALNLDVDLVKEKIDKISNGPPSLYATKSDPELALILTRDDQRMVENLSRSFNLSKLEYEKFNALVLPTVYVRGARELPTMPSSDGYQSILEVGVTLPIDTFFTRSSQRSLLAAKAEKDEVLLSRSLLDYKNQINLDISNMKRFKNQTESLRFTRESTKDLLNKAFLFYSQKRIDVLGVLDIFQKYLQAARNDLINELQIHTVDADLEYLIGAP